MVPTGLLFRTAELQRANRLVSTDRPLNYRTKYLHSLTKAGSSSFLLPSSTCLPLLVYRVLRVVHELTWTLGILSGMISRTINSRTGILNG